MSFKKISQKNFISRAHELNVQMRCARTVILLEFECCVKCFCTEIFQSMAVRGFLAPGGIDHFGAPSLLPSPSLNASLNQARGSGECCKFPSVGLRLSPSRQRFWCIFRTYAHNLSFYTHPCFNRTYRFFVYFVSQKITAPPFIAPSAGAQGMCPLPPTRRHCFQYRPTPNLDTVGFKCGRPIKILHLSFRIKRQMRRYATGSKRP